MASPQKEKDANKTQQTKKNCVVDRPKAASRQNAEKPASILPSSEGE